MTFEDFRKQNKHAICNNMGDVQQFLNWCKSNGVTTINGGGKATMNFFEKRIGTEDFPVELVCWKEDTGIRWGRMAHTHFKTSRYVPLHELVIEDYSNIDLLSFLEV